MKPTRLPHFISLLLFLLLISGCANQQSGASGSASGASSSTIVNKGSDTIVNLALAWAEKYQKLHPEVSVSVTGGGSGTGIAALVNNTVDLANASRQIKEEEIVSAEANGITPVEYIIARDAIAVIVHPDNPVERLTMQQISNIYSGKIVNWQEVGGEDRPIVRLSRETNSGTHIYFLEEVLRLGDSENTTFFSTTTLLLPSSEGITAEVRDNPNAIGYDGLGYIVPEVKVLAVARPGSSEYILPSAESVDDGTYPIARALYMYTNAEIRPTVQAYLDWILSSEAQEIVTELGFVPIE